MSDDVVPTTDKQQPKPKDADPSESPLSVRLHVQPVSEPIAPQPREQRDEAAKKRVNTRVKGWRLVKLLGVGPNTDAYEAIHGEKDNGERGVLKLLSRDFAKSERAKQQFLRAAYAANRFRHPRVVPVVADGVDDDGAPYVIRQMTDAKSLAQVIEESKAGEAEPKGKLPVARVLRMMEQVLDALEISHAHGVIHGAISPANVLITPRGSIRLVDFATPPGTLVMGQDVRDVFADTRVGPFTPPERCALPPEAPTEQSDVWALAAVAYYALSGQYPRGAETKRAELATRGAAPLREAFPDAPDAVAMLIDHALNTEPQRRYGSAYAMLGDVRRALAGRKPKLGEALRPVPSGSYRDVSLPSSRRVILADGSSAPRSSLAPALGQQTQQPSSTAREAKRKSELRGNLVLILAIALLVGVATFVVVRERVEEERNPHPKTEEAK